LVLTVAATLAIAASATAAPRPATAEEAAEIAAIYGWPAECSTVVVSQANPSYARWDFAFPRNDCPQPMANGSGIARFDGQAWRDVYQFSDGSDPCSLTPLPPGAGVELGACRAAGTNVRPRILCNSGAGGEIATSKVRPGRCMFLQPSKSYSQGENLGAIRWSSWGRTEARGTARALGFKLPYGRERVRIRFYRPRPDQCGSTLTLWTRVEIRYRRGKRVVIPQTCFGND
jgi:hypothetical protein